MLWAIFVWQPLDLPLPRAFGAVGTHQHPIACQGIAAAVRVIGGIEHNFFFVSLRSSRPCAFAPLRYVFIFNVFLLVLRQPIAVRRDQIIH
jgi:hypothetical protein